MCLLRAELQDTPLAEEFERIKEQTQRIWNEPYLPGFNHHGPLHAKRVEQNLDALTQSLQNTPNRLTPDEIFVLLSAACLPDASMQLINHPEDNNSRIAIAELARARSAAYALQLPPRQFINDQNLEGRLKLLGLLLATADALAQFEASYYRVLIPGQTEKGANQLAELPRHRPSPIGDTLALSVDYLADELDHQSGRLPDEIVFLRGIAARERGDSHAQEKYFGLVWKRDRSGPHGHIHATAAYYIGQLVQDRDPKTAEDALRDSLAWMESGPERGRVYYSLGTLLENDQSRWNESEQAYDAALELLVDPEERNEVSRARENLIHKNAQSQAEATFHKSVYTPAELPETWVTDAIRIEDLQASVHEQTYRYAISYFRRRETEGVVNTTSLADKLYAQFFEPQSAAWQNRFEFFCYIARLIRRIVATRARTQFATKLNADLHTLWVNNIDEFGTQPEADLLALEDALNRLEKIDADQVRMVELRFYVGLTVEKIAEVMQIPAATVAHEWRLAKAFLKREITRGKKVLRALNRSSLSNLSEELK